MAACAALLAAVPAQAHPLGNFTINHLAKVSINSHGLSVRYIVDMAEIPTFQIMAERGIQGDQTSARLGQWGLEEAGVVKAGLRILADGRRLQLTANTPVVSTRPGAGGLPTLYFVDTLRATFLSSVPPHTVQIVDNNYAERIGWKDIVIAPHGEPTKELRAYPNALLGSPRSVKGVRLTLDPDARIIAETTLSAQAPAPAGSVSVVRSNLLSDMLAKGSSNMAVVLLTFLIAIGLGALHALEPGHGKTLLAVSLVGARATPKQALILALALTLAHTAGVLALGVALLALAQFIVPESVYPWIALGSGALVVGLGASALARHIKLRRGFAHAHERGLDDHDGHSYDHDRQSRGHTHDHKWIPTPGNAPLSFRSVVLVAMTGNIAPCPAALVVLLAALALHRVAYGLLVVVAFSIGLAAVLTALGIVVVRGASWLSNRRGFDRLTRYGPLVTATIISLVGVVMVAKAATSVAQTSAWTVATLLILAIAGYALAPGHAHAPAKTQQEAT